MKKKLISALVAGLALSAAAVAPAQAATINVSLDGLGAVSGSSIIQFSMFSYGTLYGGTDCGSAAACDAINNASAFAANSAKAESTEVSRIMMSITGIA